MGDGKGEALCLADGDVVWSCVGGCVNPARTDTGVIAWGGSKTSKSEIVHEAHDDGSPVRLDDNRRKGRHGFGLKLPSSIQFEAEVRLVAQVLSILEKL